jgi:hypothetical protein
MSNIGNDITIPPEFLARIHFHVVADRADGPDMFPALDRLALHGLVTIRVCASANYGSAFWHKVYNHKL